MTDPTGPDPMLAAVDARIAAAARRTDLRACLRAIGAEALRAADDPEADHLATVQGIARHARTVAQVHGGGA